MRCSLDENISFSWQVIPVPERLRLFGVETVSVCNVQSRFSMEFLCLFSRLVVGSRLFSASFPSLSGLTLHRSEYTSTGLCATSRSFKTCAMNHIRKAIMGHSISHHGHLPCALHWRFIAVGIVCSCFSWFRSWTGSTTCLPRLWKAQQRHASVVVNFFSVACNAMQ